MKKLILTTALLAATFAAGSAEARSRHPCYFEVAGYAIKCDGSSFTFAEQRARPYQPPTFNDRVPYGRDENRDGGGGGGGGGGAGGGNGR